MASSKEFNTAQIRNLVVVGHGGCGKTSLIDAMAFVSGQTARHGKVDDNSALTQYRSEEKEHGMSIYCTPAYAIWGKNKINTIDTPGYMDFAGEVASGIRAADCGMVVVSAIAGAEIGTQMAWDRLDVRHLPRIAFVSKMDKEGASFENSVSSLQEMAGDKVKILPVQLPVGEGPAFKGVVDLIANKAHMFKGQKGESDVVDVPANMADDVEQWRTQLMESVAETDEELLDIYFGEGAISQEQMLTGLTKAIVSGAIVPVWLGSAENLNGMAEFMQGIVDFVPDPTHFTEIPEGATEPLPCNSDGPLAALVFKTSIEQHVGELTFFRVFSGTVAEGSDFYNVQKDAVERVGHLAVPQGRNRNEIDHVYAGDIGVLTKLRVTATNDTMTTRENPIKLAPVNFPHPDMRCAIKGETQADDDKIGLALEKLRKEDPTFVAAFDDSVKQTIARGLGETHLQVQFEKLKDRYGVTVVTSEPKIAYRETIRKEAEAQGRHKKQTGGKGQFGDCHLRLKPRARGEGYEFIDSIVGGVIPGKFIPAVDKGVQESAARGVLAGFPMVDFSCECFFGSYHPVDSSEMAFKIAGSLGFQNAVMKADPCLLEPVMSVEITIPSDALGDISGDISNRRGRISGMDTKGNRTIIHAIIPEAELYRYAASIRAMTRGLGQHTRAFYGYEIVPNMIAEKIIAAYKAEHTED